MQCLLEEKDNECRKLHSILRELQEASPERKRKLPSSSLAWEDLKRAVGSPLSFVSKLDGGGGIPSTLNVPNIPRLHHLAVLRAFLQLRRPQTPASIEDSSSLGFRFSLPSTLQNFSTEVRKREEKLQELSQQLAKAHQVTEKVKEENEKQLEAIEVKVKQALWAKDDTIRELREEMAALETKVKRISLSLTGVVLFSLLAITLPHISTQTGQYLFPPVLHRAIGSPSLA